MNVKNFEDVLAQAKRSGVKLVLAPKAEQQPAKAETENKS